MIKDRTVRRLTALEQSASTARVLNLLAVHRKYGADPDLAHAPFFKNRRLDRCLIVKHRLRPNEYGYLETPRSNVTKLLIPIDPSDLKLGARYLFVGQKDFDSVADSLFGDDLKKGSRDRMVLELLDSLPSLDPFLLREHLRRHDIEPARAYFGLSDADIQRMYDFVRQEVMSLVTMTGSGEGSQMSAGRLVDKLLSKSPESGFEPLKEVLKLSDQEYQDGVFCWRGFLYYKWVLGDLMKPIREVIPEIIKTQPRGPRDPEISAYLPEARERILRAISDISASVQEMLDIYDKAYASLTEDGKPMAFRDFLLSAPEMFADLGERLGAVQHVVSFWRYRFPPGQTRAVDGAELMDIFIDFEDSVAVSPVGMPRAKVA